MQVLAQNINIKIDDIDIILDYGKVYTNKKWLLVLRICIVSSVVELICALLCCIVDFYDYITWIMMMLIGIIILGSILLLYFYMKSGKKKVVGLMQDAVIVRAKTKKADESIAFRFPIALKATAIQIYFTFQNQRFVKSSVQKGKIACLPIYNKYVDREILIAYSPTYDKVMFLKPKSEQRLLAELAK